MENRYESGSGLDTHYYSCGSSSILSDEDQEFIILKWIENPFMPATEMRRELDLDCSPRTIHNFLKKQGIQTHHAANKPKQSERDRHLRIEFATYYLDDFDWTKCIFADESCFSSEKDGIKLVKRSINSRYDPNFCNFVDHCYRKVVSVWGAICYTGVSSLVRMDSRLNQHTYMEILDSYGIDFIKRNFGQSQCFWVDDNCPAHRPTTVNEWFENCNALHGIDFSLEITSIFTRFEPHQEGGDAYPYG